MSDETPGLLDGEPDWVESEFYTHDPDELRHPDGAEWRSYRKTTATWAVKLPVDVTVRTSHGPVEAEGGDYLCISANGDLYPCSAETFEKQYEETEGVE